MRDEKPVVVVTGSSGLLGSALCKRLNSSYSVVGMDKSGPKNERDVAKYVYIDLTSDESVKQSFDELRDDFGSRIASFVHLAAYHEFTGEYSPLYKKISIDGTERVLKQLHSFKTEQFVFSSTMLVHAPTEPGKPINEDSPIEAKWPHPQSKLDTELVIREHHGEIPLVILRIAGFYNEMCHSIPLSYQIKRIVERSASSKVFPGDVSHGEPYVHVLDVVDAVVRSIERRSELPREFVALIAEKNAMSYDERQKLIGRLVHGEEGDDWVTREIPKAIAKAGTWLEENTVFDDNDPFTASFAVELAGDHYELDVSRAKSALGWEPKHRLRDTIPLMVENLKQDPLGWCEANKIEPSEEFKEMAAVKGRR